VAGEPVADALRVFLDCERFICDLDHIRQEVDFVSYVRDREDAQVHVLVTFQETGGGGAAYTFNFIGLGDQLARDDTLQYVSRQNDTDDETRTGVTQVFRLGLMRYVARTPFGELLRISYEADEGGAGSARQSAPLNDPWNLWTFRISVSGELEGESRERQTSFDGSISANRTTEAFKITSRFTGSSGRRIFLADRAVHRRPAEARVLARSEAFWPRSRIARSLCGPLACNVGHPAASLSTESPHA